MTAPFRLACVQTSSGNDLAANVDAASALIRQAVDGGADFVALPECVSMIEPDRTLVYDKAAEEAQHPALQAFQGLAAELRVPILVGSLAVRVPGRRVANRSYLVDQAGLVVASYDKIHMFDVELAGGESYRESATYAPGDEAVIAPTPWGLLGMTVCYDVRFPQLYRALAHAGATMLSVPSAFTVPTGEAHWHVLLRSRAIETGCFVFAPAQCGIHNGSRRTYGHSLIVDPWGTVLADGGTDVGVVMAEIDPARVAEARKAVPSLTHDRAFADPSVQPRLHATGE